MQSTIKTPCEENLRFAAKLLKSDKLVAFPTETVYGLGANAFSLDAVDSIFACKARPKNDPLIVHTSSLEQAKGLISESASDKVLDRLDRLSVLWPGPLSVIAPKSEKVPDLVTSNLPFIAIRIPKHPVALKMIEYADLPIAAPSANPFGYISPTRAVHVASTLGDKIDCILDGGPCQVGIESTVIDISCEKPKVLRPGKFGVDQLSQLLGENVLQALGSSKPSNSPSPGLTDKHYSPRTPCVLLEDFVPEAFSNKEIAFIAFSSDSRLEQANTTEILSTSGSPEQIANNLFAALFEIDQKANYDLVVIDTKLKSAPISAAIRDRIKRACA